MQIDAIEPDCGAIGDEVVITGSGFGHNKLQSIVTVGGYMASTHCWSDGTLKIRVPGEVRVSESPIAVTVNGEVQLVEFEIVGDLCPPNSLGC